MDKYFIDYDNLQQSLDKPKVFKYEDVKHRLEKVAFGTVRFMDASEEIDGLWEIQNTDDGDVIVAKYDHEDSKDVMTTKSSWDVILDKRGSALNIFYQGEPIAKIATSQFGVAQEDLPNICKSASIKLENDSQFRSTLLKEIHDADRAIIFSKYPELAE